MKITDKTKQKQVERGKIKRSAGTVMTVKKKGDTQTTDFEELDNIYLKTQNKKLGVVLAEMLTKIDDICKDTAHLNEQIKIIATTTQNLIKELKDEREGDGF